MRVLVVFLVVAFIATAAYIGRGTASPPVMYSSTNFSIDMVGEPDTREGTWGTAGYHTWAIQFWPPPGKRVEIVSVHGDLVSWIRWGGAPEPGRYAGVLFGLQTTEPEGSVRGDWLADNTFLYIQDAVGLEPRRAPFSMTLNRVLPPDNKLLVKVAVWLNETGLHVHMEPTFTVGYRFID